MNKHTPGPWDFPKEQSAIRYTVNDMHNRHVAMVSCYCAKQGDEVENLANAQLIAAAPDMLEALKSLVSFTERTTEGWTEADLEILDQAQTAIAKATGGDA